MRRVLITAFAPYDSWSENASWLTLVELTRDLPDGLVVTTRRYPVNFDAVKEMLTRDLEGGYDIALHLGQAPGTSRVHLEAFGVNIGGSSGQLPEDYRPLSSDGPAAFRSALPLARWAKAIRAAGIPAQVSYHAGTYLCNATLYWSHYLAAAHALPIRSTFIHVPLDPSQVLGEPRETPHMPAAMSAAAIRLILLDLATS